MKHISSIRSKQQSGFVSIVVAALLMVILALITLGFTRLMQREQRQAIDRYLSRQALYAAESGINDVAARIADPTVDPIYDLQAKSDCDVTGLGPSGDGRLSSDGTVAYTCALFDRTPDTLEYTTDEQHSKITELNTASGNPLDTLTITWGNSDLDPNNNLLSNLPACGFDAQDLPPARSNAPPVLKVDLTKIGARYVRSDMLRDTEYFYLMPCDGGAAPTNFAFNPTDTQRGRVVQVRCTGTGSRPCTFTIDSMSPFNSSKYFLRMRPIYTSATVTVEGTEAGGLPVAFNNAQVSIDITAKAGDVIRRLRASLPIADITTDMGIPEAVLQGFDGICKQIDVVDLAAPSEVLDYCITSSGGPSPIPPPPPPPPPVSLCPTPVGLRTDTFFNLSSMALTASGGDLNAAPLMIDVLYDGNTLSPSYAARLAQRYTDPDLSFSNGNFRVATDCNYTVDYTIFCGAPTGIYSASGWGNPPTTSACFDWQVNEGYRANFYTQNNAGQCGGSLLGYFDVQDWFTSSPYSDPSSHTATTPVVLTGSTGTITCMEMVASCEVSLSHIGCPNPSSPLFSSILMHSINWTERAN